MVLDGKRVCVFGMGRSGLSALKFLKKFKTDLWAVNAGDPRDWQDFQEVAKQIGADRCIDENNASAFFACSDLIILSPGIPREHPALGLALQKGVPVWNEIELAFRFIDSPVIGITGTNGKTTTVTMLGEMIKNSGHSVFVGGNIGVPLCEYLLHAKKVDFVLLELSSFQLESIEEFRPHVAVILNISPNHGERYSKVEDYAKAKFHITKNMMSDDLLIYPSNFEMIESWAQTQTCMKLPLDLSQTDKIKEALSSQFDLKNFKLPGQHNLTNLYVCSKVMENLKLKKEGVQKTIETFKGVHHRVEYVETSKKYVAYNDAKSTNWEATLAAVNSMEKGNKKLYLIVGGQKRGRNDSILPVLSELKKRVDRVYLIGETSDLLASDLESKMDYLKAGVLDNVISELDRENFDGILLLSPAFPSYDQFKNYEKRGEYFVKLLSE